MVTPRATGNGVRGLSSLQLRFSGTDAGFPFNDGADAFGFGGCVFFGLRISRLLLRSPLDIGSLLLRVRAGGQRSDPDWSSGSP
jgi:hypothetical protein